MKLKTRYILIGLFFFIILTYGIVTLFSQEKEDSSTSAKSNETIIIGAGRGDYVYVPPEEDCQRLLKNYLNSSEFTNKGFSDCELIEGRENVDCDECKKYGFDCPLAGCDICKLECH